MSPHLIGHDCITRPFLNQSLARGMCYWLCLIKIHPVFPDAHMADQDLNKDGIFSARKKEGQKHLLSRQSVLSATKVK